MILTTKPIVTAEQKVIRPEFIRLPKPGTPEPWTNLSRSTLNLLVLPCKENGFRPPVRSCSLRRRGNVKGVRLIDFQSLLDYINSHVEPRFEAKPPQAQDVRNQSTASIHKVRLDESLQLAISISIDKAIMPAAAQVPAGDLQR